ncbi:sensor domain-containing protein [Reinekea marinisedimentorum]|uniref:PAS domain S-box-containing protein/diguanylate cyclase (GGDEF)-like protein n=1 Tax=Reinekea marinisedimentorum TaxID=230495 RepID=A0A4R3I2D6_9GAMM|nr:bifunctional diguanylate cyclase/phosphodiesterase [Reinekea marinisedimentorum]TCS38911.1 PAS domain S-box-containing protein/diguanylate cyclase (GGDEF)-like protein [Reinekea marinisedimentorum]
MGKIGNLSGYFSRSSMGVILFFNSILFLGLLFIGFGLFARGEGLFIGKHQMLFTQLDHEFLRLGFVVPGQALGAPESAAIWLEVAQLTEEINRLESATHVPASLFENFTESVADLRQAQQAAKPEGISANVLSNYIIARSHLVSALEQDEINRASDPLRKFNTPEGAVIVLLLICGVLQLALVLHGFRKFISRNQLLTDVLNAIPDPVVAKNYDGNFIFCNETVAQLYNSTPEAMVGKDDAYFTGNQQQADFFRENVRKVMRQFKTEEVYEDSTDANTGEIRHFLSVKVPFRDRQNNLCITVVARDVTEIVELKDRAERNEKRLESIFEVSGEGLWEWNTQTNEVGHNAQWESITGVLNSESSFEEFDNCIFAEDRSRVHAALTALLESNETYNIEFRMKRPDGNVLWIWDRGQVAEYDEDGKPLWVVGIMQDVTQEKINQQQIENLAYYDSLTQLPNRSMLKDRLTDAISHHCLTNIYGAVLFLDLDRFKLLNDSYGHQVGDQLLVEVGKRIHRRLRAEDTVARFGGDEFVLILHQLNENAEVAAEQAMATAESIRDSLCEVFHLHHENIKNVIDYYITVSIGGVIFKTDDADANALIQMADMALYKVKKDGRNDSLIFGPEMRDELNRERDIKRELRRAISENQFSVYYQPKYDFNQQLIGAEALVRWFHPELGMIPPCDFIMIAEQANLIVAIGDVVLNDACSKLQEWQYSDETASLGMSVNFSAKQIRQKDFCEHFVEIIGAYNFDYARLTLEVTETALLEDLDVAIEKLTELKKLGIRVSLDDFGTGYSSLTHLKGLPIDEIKIDRSFVRDIKFDESDLIMVKSILDLGRNFSIDVISEGVEDVEQLNLLTKLGCQYFQGFYFGKPVPYTDFKHFIITEV